MDSTPFELPGLDISVLTTAKSTETRETIPATNGADMFPIRDNSQGIPEEKEEKIEIKGEKKDLPLFEKPSIDVREDETPTQETTIDSIDTVVSPVKAIAEYLKEQGVAEFTDEEFKDDDTFIPELVTKSITKGVTEYKESLDPEIKRLIELKEEGVPLAQYLEHERVAFEYTQVTPDKLKDNTELQKTIVNNYLVEQNWDAGEIEEKLKELEDSGLLEKDASRSLSKLIQIENIKKESLVEQNKTQKAQSAAKYQEQLNKLNDTLKNTKEFIPGLTTNETEKKLVFEAITKFDKNRMNKVAMDLQNPDNYMKVAYLANVLKWDFSKLKTIATTAATKDIKQTIASTPAKSKFSGVDLSILKKAALFK